MHSMNRILSIHAAHAQLPEIRKSAESEKVADIKW
jgi:hypothetical protein